MRDESQTSTQSEDGFRLSAPTSLPEATPAKKTVTPDSLLTRLARRSALSSSGLLMRFARELFYARIHPSLAQMPIGLGTGSDPSWNELVTLCCPLNSDPVALALTTNGSGCSCSPKFRTPTARDWKGMSAKSWRERTDGKDTEPTLADQLGGVPHPEFVEEIMGYEIGHTDLDRLGMPLIQESQSGSDAGS
jgi:hypothetical protein